MSDTARPSALAPFRVRNYRLQWPADLFTSWAFEMETIILGWYILVETGSVLLLTLFASLIYIGTLIAPMFGTIGDRIGHRNLLTGMRAAYCVIASTIALLALTGVLNPVFVFVLATMTGLVRPSDLGVRAALVAATIPFHHLTSAMSVSRTTMDSARMAGALTGAGLFAQLGMAPAYIVITCLYLLATLLTFCIHPPEKKATQAAAQDAVSPLRDLRDGLGYIWNKPLLRALMWVAFLANLAAYPATGGLLPYIARDVFGTDQTGLGYLSASYAVGSLVGSMLLSVVGVRSMGRLMIFASIAWYLMLLVFANLQSFPAAIICLAATGFAQSLCMISIAVTLLRAAEERFRGRIMGVRMMMIYGLPIGLLAAGSLIERFGFAVTGSLYAVVGLIWFLAIVFRWRGEVWERSAPANGG